MGASRTAVAWMILREGLALAAVGVAIGITGSLAVTRLIRKASAVSLYYANINKVPGDCKPSRRRANFSSTVAPFYLLKTVANTAGKPAHATENILTFNPTGAIGASGVNNGFAIEYNEVSCG